VEPTQQRYGVLEDVRSGAPISVVDVAVGATVLATVAAASLARRVRPRLEPLARVVLNPPMVPSWLQPRQWLDSLARLGAETRTLSRRQVSRLFDALVPVVAEEVLRRADLNMLVTRYVDLNGVVATVDLDAVAARIDIDAIARRLDLDTVLDRLDLTATVLTRVDLDVLVHAALERVDFVGMAEEIIGSIDLPEIIRESTGAMTSDSVRSARMQGIAADEAVGRAMNRLLRRGGRRPIEDMEPSSSLDQARTDDVSSEDHQTR
jgi:hypothetical protein